MAAGYAVIPLTEQETLWRYIAHGYAPGHFLTAVLENNLQEAVARADADNQARLPAYVQWLYHNAPARSWGSPALVAAWTAARRRAARTATPQDEEE